jgi:glycosyltransferase involved in cell wall biosynthesis
VNIGVITNDMPPYSCGIGDHTINLANAIRFAGDSAVIISARGDPSENIYVVECDWDQQGLEKLFKKLESLDLDHLILQFTPLMYLNKKNHDGHELQKFWKKCTLRWSISIIVHETYFRTWWHPPSWINGLLEKQLLKKMVANSRFAFTASQPLVNEMKDWRNNTNVQLLPIGSNFPFVEIDKNKAKEQVDFQNDEIVLLLFGGGNTLKWMKKYVHATDALLYSKGIKARWLLLGGVPESWFKLKLPVISPGRLSEQQISTWLQASDIFLMPHYAGLCAKRGTLMAAMQHALPVVGTRSKMTDPFWDEVKGVQLSSLHAAGEFAQQVLALALNQQLRKHLGRVNQEYFQRHFTWENIVRSFLEVVK